MDELVRELESDAHLRVFLRADCNVSAIASAVIARGSTSEPRTSSLSVDDDIHEPRESDEFVKCLDTAVHRIDRVIADHVGEHHATLLDQVSSVDELKTHLAGVKSSVTHLQQSIQTLQTQVCAQQAHLRNTLQQYRNIEQCSDLVRHVLRFQHLSKRVLTSAVFIDTQSPLTTDARQRENVSVALAIRELDHLRHAARFTDLSVVRAKVPALDQLTMTFKRNIRSSLQAGIQNSSQNEIRDAFELLFYLGDLKITAHACVNDVVQDVERACRAVIAEDKLVRINSSLLNNSDSSARSIGSAVSKADVWKAVEEFFNVIRVYALQVWNMQRVLLKMIESQTNQSYLELVLDADEPSLFATYWEVTCVMVHEVLASTRGYSSAVQSVLIAEYPRMREQATRVLNDLLMSTTQSAASDFLTVVPANEKGEIMEESFVKRELVPIAASIAERTQLLNAMSPLYEAYIDRAYNRIMHPIQLMFPQSSNYHASPPSRSDMQTLSQTIFAELEHAGHDGVLLEGMLQQVQKAVTRFCDNVQKMIHHGKAAATPLLNFGRTPSQAHNVGLFNALSLLHDTIKAIETYIATATSSAENLDVSTATVDVKASSTTKLLSCQERIENLQYALLGSYLQTLAGLLEPIFAKMHNESFGLGTDALKEASVKETIQSRSNVQTAQGTRGSKYMQEVSHVFAVILDEHLRRLPKAALVMPCLVDFVERLMSTFVRHAALLRPLTERGKLRLANDMTQLELRLEQVVPLRKNGAPYEELRAFRHMLFLENHEILRDATIDKIRPSNVWHHLISRAPAELQLPHRLRNWTATKYIEWLDTCAAIDQSSLPSTSVVASSEKVLTHSWRDVPLGMACLKDPQLALQVEKQAWKVILECLDAYSQRASISTNAERSPIYDLLQESSALLLAGYEVLISR
ncbi:uncharacterized protein CCR75_003262 [Bremia lactucae]|uniref:Conserved oligomeric Golgi complex subunit 5 n=1 Tax=Bremia lactucae TaxID=4779 RepID=A0A976NY45_BRELC|nr:hypothetical protein CCR75_003262 [Bremia lactucae]